MKKITWGIYLFAFPFLLKAQDCPKPFAGTKTLYPVPTQTHKLPPKGYYPAFINYVGRHGARHLTNDVNTSFAYIVLRRGDSLQLLTAKGQQLWKMMQLLDTLEKNGLKSISEEGRQELKGIARRMYNLNNELFPVDKPFPEIKVTKEKRTQQSATAFVSGIKEIIKPGMKITTVIEDTLLRFYDLSPAYLQFKEHGNWVPLFESIKKSVGYNTVIEHACNRLFISSFTATLSSKERTECVEDIFGFTVIVPSLKQEIIMSGLSDKDFNFRSFFTCEELGILGKVANAEDFFLKGPGSDNMGVQVKIAAPLLADFISTTDMFIRNNDRPVQLRFAHAETIAPFSALLGIENASKSNITATFDKDWKADEVIPLSANIQWILYRNNNSDNWLVKIMLNEKEVTISGLSTTTFPYYNWKELKAFYSKRLKGIGFDFKDNPYRYLQNLK